jgi:hypothetical protein
MPTFCRHGRFLQNCRICNRPEPKPAAPRERSASGSPVSASSRSPSSPRRGSGGRGGSAVVVKRVARAVEDGYACELVPGLKASDDARRLAAEIAFATARLAELAADPPGLYAEAAVADDREEALWLAFQIAHVCPRSDDGPFASINQSRTTWTSAEPPRLCPGVALGPRTTVDAR